MDAENEGQERGRRGHLRLVYSRPNEVPPEIAEFQRRTDPYSNMLPGASNISGFRTLAEGVSLGKHGHPLLAAVSLILLLLMAVPLILTIAHQIIH